MEHTIEWENLILPIDPADISPDPSGNYPESATIVDKAVHHAATLVLQSALDETGANFTQEQWPTRQEYIKDAVIDITGGQVMPELKANWQYIDDMSWERLVLAAVMPTQVELIARLRRDYPGRTQ